MAQVNLRDYARVLVKWRKLIILNVLIIVSFAVVLSLALPKKYTATATLLPPLEISGFHGLGATLGQEYLGGLGGLVGLPGMATASDLFAAILISPRVLRETVGKCDLLAVYKTESFQEAVRQLREKTRIRVSSEGMISISVTARSPTLAARIANVLIEELDRFNRETSMSMGKRQRVFLEERLKEVERSLSDAENGLREFQEKHRTVLLDEELTQAIEAVAYLQAEIITREIQLGVLLQYATEENPKVRRLRSEIAEFKEGVRRIEYGQASQPDKPPTEFGAGFSVPFADLPQVALELARLTREATIQGEVYALLTEQYEQAKIAEVKDTPTVQILDEAVPPERRSHPQRKKIVVIAGVISLFVGVGMAFSLEHLEGLKSRPEEYRDWREILGQLAGDIRSLKSAILRK